MRACRLSVGVMAACAAFAIPVQTEIAATQPDSPLKLTTGHCVAAPGSGSPTPPWVRCDVSLTNLTPHKVVAYTVVWTPVERAGTNYSSKFSLEPRPPLIAPGKTVKHRTYLTKRDSAVNAGVEFVLFDDGTYWGEDRGHALKTIQDEITMQRAAPEDSSVKRTVDSNLADQARDKYLSARKMEGMSR